MKNLLESFLLPTEKSTASRGLETEYWTALNETLKDTVLVLGDGLIPLNKKYINLTKPSVITAFYKRKNGKHVGKVVSIGQNLCLSKKCLFGNVDPDFTTKILVEYYTDEKMSNDLPGSGDIIGYLWPRYVDEDQLLKPVSVIADVLKESPRVEIIREIKQFLFEQYGSVHESNLLSWLQSHKLIAP